MIFEIRRESDNDKVREFLISNNIPYEERDEVFDSWDGINLYETLTSMFGVNPSLEGNDVVDMVYQRTPKILKKLFEQYKYDKGYSVEESRVIKLEKAINEFYSAVIEEELEEMIKEGVVEKVTKDEGVV